MASAGGSPKKDQSGYHEDVCARVEEAVQERVELQVLNRVWRVPSASHHMMPLEDLLEHDAVEEPAKTEAEQDASRSRKRSIFRIDHAHETGRSPVTGPAYIVSPGRYV